ncbi:MAG: jacalin-like lectin [Pseudomonadota bacterium]
MSIVTKPIGGDGGKSFGIQAVRTIGFRSGNRVDALVLNGSRKGGNGGRESKVLELQGDEYIEHMEIWDNTHKGRSRRIHKISLQTSRGRTLSVGKQSGNKTVLSGVRVLGLGGNSGAELDKLRIRYIKDYTPSDMIEQGALAVIGVIPQGQTTETFVSSRVSKLSASSLFLEIVSSIETTTETGGAVGEFTAKASTTFGLSVTTSSEFREEIETETVESERITYAPPEGHVGLEVIQIDVFKANDGTIWQFPVSEPSIVSTPVASTPALFANVYDMTGTLSLNFPALVQDRVEKNGQDYYALRARAAAA